MTSRRGFLKMGAGAAAGIAVLGYLERFIPAGPFSADTARRVQPPVLSDREFDTLAAVAAVLIGAPAGTLSTRDTLTAERIELELSKARSTLASDVKAALKLVETLPALMLVGPRFTRLTPEQQADFLQRLRSSDLALLRSCYSGLRFLVMFFYYSDPRAWPRLGYSGPWTPPKFYEGGNRIVNLQALTGGQP